MQGGLSPGQDRAFESNSPPSAERAVESNSLRLAPVSNSVLPGACLTDGRKY